MWDQQKESRIIWTFSKKSGDYPNHLETSPTIRRLPRSNRNFPNSRESFRICGDFLNSPETFKCNFKVTRKNFPELQKLSGWHCQPGLWFSADQFRLSRRVGLGLGLGPTSTQDGPGAQILRHTLHKSYRCPSLGKVFFTPKIQPFEIVNYNVIFDTFG